ncbi:hypothetical protein HYW60_02085 [Candidatus Kaiserbacteria bacterium]|nr:hypothetical protein [Candidatus Kaiserbacteria bacterium]
MGNPEQPKSPWARGDWAERVLKEKDGEGTVEALRDEHRRRTLIDEDRKEHHNDMRAAAVAARENPEQGTRLVLEAGKKHSRRIIDIHGGTICETFRVERDAGLIRVGGREYFTHAGARDEDYIRPRFLQCVLPKEAVDDEGYVVAFTPDDIRRAAREFQERWPEVVFSFDEDRQRGLFSYTATVAS